MIARGELSEDENKRFLVKETDFSPSSKATIDQILRLPEKEFWGLVSIRLNVPQSKANLKELGDEHHEYWSWNYLVEEIFLQIATLKTLVTHNGKQIRIYKYYSQALRLRKLFL